MTRYSPATTSIVLDAGRKLNIKNFLHRLICDCHGCKQKRDEGAEKDKKQRRKIKQSMSFLSQNYKPNDSNQPINKSIDKIPSFYCRFDDASSPEHSSISQTKKDTLRPAMPAKFQLQ